MFRIANHNPSAPAFRCTIARPRANSRRCDESIPARNPRAAGGLAADAKGGDEASDGGDTIPSDLSDDHIGEDVVYADEPARGSSLTSSAYFSARSPVDDGVE